MYSDFVNTFFRKTSWFDYDTDAFALITAAGYTNLGVKLAINKFFVSSKLKGLYTKINAGYLNITDDISSNSHSLEQMKWNFVNPQNTDVAYRRTYYNNPTADYSGLDFDGSTQYVDPHYIISNTSENSDLSVVVYLTKDTGGFKTDVGCLMGGYDLILGSANSTNVALFYCDGGVYYPNPDGMVGLWHLDMGGVQKHTYKNGYLFDDRAGQSTTASNNIYEGATNLSGTPTWYSDRKRVYSHFGKSFTAQEVLDHSVIVNTLQEEVEIALNLTPGTRKKF